MVHTDHSPRLKVANGLSAERLRQQLDVVARVNEELAPFRLLAGIEVNSRPERLDPPKRLLRLASARVVAGRPIAGAALGRPGARCPAPLRRDPPGGQVRNRRHPVQPVGLGASAEDEQVAVGRSQIDDARLLAANPARRPGRP